MKYKKENIIRPPGMAEWLLRRMTRRHEKFSILGDYEEEFLEIARYRSLREARIWYWKQTWSSTIPFVFNKLFWSLAMIKNYLKIAFRNMKKHKSYSFINIIGLAIGMACCILIMAYIFHELSYDRFHKNADRIYRMGTHFDFAGTDTRAAVSNLPPAVLMKQEFPEVVDFVRFRRYHYRTLVEYKENRFFEDDIFYADASIFEVFSFSLIRGDIYRVLDKPHTIVITRDMANRYFGTEDPIGKIIRLDNREDFTITGIMENIPSNSHMSFEMLCSLETLFSHQPILRERWMGDFNNYTYLLLREDLDPAIIESKFPALIDRHIGHILKAVEGNLEFFLQPVGDIHLHSNVVGEIGGNSDIAYIYIFSAIVLFILLIACINFMNLSTARSAHRAKEVGMRKVLGSHRTQLIKQFLGESTTYSIIAFFLALLLVGLVLPVFRSISGAQIQFGFFGISWVLFILFGFIFFVGLVAGSYPAFFLSAFRPIRVLRGQAATGRKNSLFRNGLVVFQFSISIILIISTGIIMKQLKFMREQRLGFNKEHVVVLEIIDDSIRRSLDTIKAELKQHPGVVNVAITSHVPGQGARHNAFMREGSQYSESIMMGAISIDHDFIETLDMELVAGRNFSPEMITDQNQSVLINETASRQLGWDDPLGKRITELTETEITKTVIGVVRDFHIMSLRNEIEPVVIENEPNPFNFVAIRIQPGRISETMDFLEKKWESIDFTGPFDYFFLDESFDSQYRAEERLRTLFSYFTMFAILIACLGLFGLASYTAEQRSKEIGIRKVLGASVSEVVLLLSRAFTKWVLIANLFAWPVSWFVMRRWLQNFAYRTELGITSFVFSGLLAFLIALMTVGYQAMKTARANPAEALKYE